MKETSWQERFDKKFADPFGDARPDEVILAYSVDSNDAKAFIAKELTATWNAALATVEEKVKAQMVDVRPEIRVWLRGTRETNEAHNQSLEAVLSLINELKKQS